MNEANFANSSLKQLLIWYLEAGVDESIGHNPVNRLISEEDNHETGNRKNQLQESKNQTITTNLDPTETTVKSANAIAKACKDLNSLQEALDSFDGCTLKKTAMQLAFADGNPKANIMIIGEAPGNEEDRAGKPFVGPAGKLLDKMLESIGLNRTNVYITNIVPWRPPGNRNPSVSEVTICMPFLERQIELVAPSLLILVGGVASNALLGTKQGITKIRGRWYTYHGNDTSNQLEIPTIPIFHTAYLLRSPSKKKEAWSDLLKIKKHLDDLE